MKKFVLMTIVLFASLLAVPLPQVNADELTFEQCQSEPIPSGCPSEEDCNNDPTLAGCPKSIFENVCNQPNATESTVCKDKDNQNDPFTGSEGILIKGARVLATLTGIASVIMIIFGSFKLVTSNGDSNSINNARSTIIYACIGLVVALLAQGIITFVLNRV
jgi:hypothetical protein